MTVNKWNAFVKKYRTEHPDKSYKQALKECSELKRLHGDGIYDSVMNKVFGGKNKNNLKDG